MVPMEHDPMKQETHKIAFPPLMLTLPALGEGSAADWRRAGKALGAEFGRRWITIHVEANARGVLTTDRADEFQRKATADMLANVANLRTRGYAKRDVAVFENSMIENYKRILSRFHEQPQTKPS